MKTSRFILYSILIAIATTTMFCESNQKEKSEKTQYEEIYLNQFKLTYFKELLRKSYNNSNAVQDIIINDHSGFTEPILTKKDFDLIDSLTTLENKRIIIDSSKSHFRAEGAHGKRPLGFIMDRLTSVWLDSLAKSRMKIQGLSDNLSD